MIGCRPCHEGEAGAPFRPSETSAVPGKDNGSEITVWQSQIDQITSDSVEVFQDSYEAIYGVTRCLCTISFNRIEQAATSSENVSTAEIVHC